MIIHLTAEQRTILILQLTTAEEVHQAALLPPTLLLEATMFIEALITQEATMKTVHQVNQAVLKEVHHIAVLLHLLQVQAVMFPGVLTTQEVTM